MSPCLQPLLIQLVCKSIVHKALLARNPTASVSARMNLRSLIDQYYATVAQTTPPYIKNNPLTTNEEILSEALKKKLLFINIDEVQVRAILCNLSIII